DPAVLAALLRCCGRGSAAPRRLRRAFPPPLALLPPLLRRRLPWRRHRRCAGDVGEDLTGAGYSRTSSRSPVSNPRASSFTIASATALGGLRIAWSSPG